MKNKKKKKKNMMNQPENIMKDYSQEFVMKNPEMNFMHGILYH